MRQRAAGVGSVGVDIARAPGDAAGLGLVVELDSLIITRTRRIVVEDEVAADLDGDAVAVAIAIGAGCSQRDEIAAEEARCLVVGGRVVMNHRAALVERHDACCIDREDKDDLAARFGAADHLSALERQHHCLARKRVGQAGGACIDAERIALAAARSFAVRAVIEGEEVRIVTARIDGEIAVVYFERPCLANCLDGRAVIGKTNVAAKVERHGFAGGIAVLVDDGSRALEREDTGAEDRQLAIIGAVGIARKRVVDLFVLGQRDYAGRSIDRKAEDLGAVRTADHIRAVEGQGDGNAIAGEPARRIVDDEPVAPGNAARAVCAVGRAGDREGIAEICGGCVGIRSGADRIGVLRGQDDSVAIDHGRVDRRSVIAERQGTADGDRGGCRVAVTVRDGG